MIFGDQPSVEEFLVTYEIFWISGSPYAWAVLLAMEVKGLAYQSRLLDRSKDEHKAADFLAINPRGTVPVLKGEQNGQDVVVSEAIAILAYLDKKHPTIPLFGQTPEETGYIWQLVSEIDGYIRAPIADGITQPIFRGKVKDTNSIDAVKAARAPAHKALTWIDDKLAGTLHLAGDALSAADLMLLPVIQAVTRAAGKDAAATLDLGILPLADTYSAIAAWLTHMEALPGYANTYPPHWRD